MDINKQYNYMQLDDSKDVLEEFPEEKEFARWICGKLSQEFDVFREVMGTHFSGARLRIDAIISPKNKTAWKNDQMAFGVEFKRPDSLISSNSFTKWIAQCVDYANTNWDSFGYIHVLTCPGVSYYKAKQSILENEFSKTSNKAFADEKLEKKIEQMYFIANVMAQLGVGELRNTYKGLAIYLQKPIWNEMEGCIYGKHWSLKRRFGSR